MTICAPTHHIVTRGDTLGGANLTVIITSPMPDVIRVQTYHYMGNEKKSPEFELNLSTPRKLEVTDGTRKNADICQFLYL